MTRHHYTPWRRAPFGADLEQNLIGARTTTSRAGKPSSLAEPHSEKPSPASKPSRQEDGPFLSPGVAPSIILDPGAMLVALASTTYTRSLFRAARDHIQWDPMTKMFEQMRYDPDGQSCWNPDTDSWVRGMGYFDWQVRVPGS